MCFSLTPPHPHPQPCDMHISAPRSSLWPFLNKIIIFFDISLGCMLKLCLKWKLDCNHYQYQAVSHFWTIIYPGAQLITFQDCWGLSKSHDWVETTLDLPKCQVGGNEWHLRLKVFLFPCSRFKSVFLASGKGMFLWGIRIEFCLVVDVKESFIMRAGKRNLWDHSLSLTFDFSVNVPWGKGWLRSWALTSCFYPPLFLFSILKLCIRVF